jgi:hypothetical protein
MNLTRSGYLRAGLASGVNATFPDQGVTPSMQPGAVVNLSEIPWTPLTDPVAGKPYRRAAALSQLLWGKKTEKKPARQAGLLSGARWRIEGRDWSG